MISLYNMNENKYKIIPRPDFKWICLHFRRCRIESVCLFWQADWGRCVDTGFHPGSTAATGVASHGEFSFAIWQAVF